MNKSISYLTYFLIIIGALNWGLVGFFGFDLVAFLFGDMTLTSRIIYSLVGISAIISLIYEFTSEKMEKSTHSSH